MTEADETYHVVLLVEQALTAADARQVRSLHEGLDEPVVYHVLLPIEDAAARIEASMGSLAAGEVLASPAMTMRDVDLEAVRHDCEERSREDLETTLAVAPRGRRDRDRPGGRVPADRRAGSRRHRGRRA